MLTGVEILIWLVRETTNSCVYVGESSSKGHEAVGKPSSDAEGQPLLNAARSINATKFEVAAATHLCTALKHTPHMVDTRSTHRTMRFRPHLIGVRKGVSYSYDLVVAH